jgi:hypothetical protein
MSAALSSITKSVKRSLFALTTPSKPPKFTVETPSKQNAPQTPHHMTIKSSIKTAGVSVSKPQANSPSRRHASQTPRNKQAQKQISQTPRAQIIQQAASPGTSTGIVQFQLQDGKFVDVDFSRSPQSALQEVGSEAIGEVRAKIETYANQFMQYMKFFKKFKPT